MTDTMHWHIFDARGQLIAATRYANDAAKVAISYGPDATVRHGNRVVLTVTESTIEAGALSVADAMIAAAYNRERAA